MFHVPCVRVDVPPEADREVSGESLDRLGWVLSMLVRSPSGRLHLALTGASIDALMRHHPELAMPIRALANEGRLDLACTPHDAAMLPFLPEAEIERQLLLQEHAVALALDLQPRRELMWPTALAVSEVVLRVAARLDFSVVMVDADSIPDIDAREGRRIDVAEGRPGLHLLPVARRPALTMADARFATVMLELSEPSPDLSRLFDALTRRRCLFAQDLPGLVPTGPTTRPFPWAAAEGLAAERSQIVERLSNRLTAMETAGLSALPARRSSRAGLDRALRGSRWFPKAMIDDLDALERQLGQAPHTSA